MRVDETQDIEVETDIMVGLTDIQKQAILQGKEEARYQHLGWLDLIAEKVDRKQSNASK